MARINYGDVEFREGTAEFEIDGYRIIIDEEDLRKVMQYGWYVQISNHGGDPLVRAARNFRLAIQELVLDYKSSTFQQIDHRNRNPLDNRKDNLRIVEVEEQMQNRRGWGVCKYKGVTPRNEKWRARIQVNGKEIALGTFDTPKTAAKAYNFAALKYYGPDAYINEI